VVLVKFILWEWKYGTDALLPFQEALTGWLLLERVLGYAYDAAYEDILFSIILSSKRIRPINPCRRSQHTTGNRDHSAKKIRY
jgi:hypothetical protein